MARVAFFKGNYISTTVRGTLYTHFVNTVPHIPRVAFFNGNSISIPVRRTLYKYLYTPFLV